MVDSNEFLPTRSMNIHFICRGNVLRSLIAETYLRSLQLPGVTVTSSGTNVDLSSPTERQFFANTIDLFERHGIARYAKNSSDQLTQQRANGQDITICMNQRVVDEAAAMVKLPGNTKSWDITDVGEGHRVFAEALRLYEEEIFQEIVARVDALAVSIVNESNELYE